MAGGTYRSVEDGEDVSRYRSGAAGREGAGGCRRWVYFDAQYKRIYLNSTIKIKGESFLKHMFSNPLKIQNDKLFRVFSNVRRLRLFNVGARLRQGKDISFQSY